MGQTHPRLMCSELGRSSLGTKEARRGNLSIAGGTRPCTALIPKCPEVNYEARPLFIGVNADKTPSRRIAMIDGFC